MASADDTLVSPFIMSKMEEENRDMKLHVTMMDILGKESLN